MCSHLVALSQEGNDKFMNFLDNRGKNETGEVGRFAKWRSFALFSLFLLSLPRNTWRHSGVFTKLPWPARISKPNRLDVEKGRIYQLESSYLLILSCRLHYIFSFSQSRECQALLDQAIFYIYIFLIKQRFVSALTNLKTVQFFFISATTKQTMIYFVHYLIKYLI